MGVEICIWLLRMYRYKLKQERLQPPRPPSLAQETRNTPQTSHATEDGHILA
jgi:hypothetical protein